MCLLTVFPMPDLIDARMASKLANGAALNDDGHGWAVVSNGRILTGKSLNSGEAIEQFMRAYYDATGPAFFHSRWATHGSKTLSNVHPFPVRKMADTYLAHNGIMPAASWPAKDDKRSDTRVFADDILPLRYGRLDSFKVREHLDSWLGGNKIAILTTNRRFRRNLYVFGLERGEWVDGAWFSNSDHEGYGRWLKGADASEPADDECCYCHQPHVDKYGFCMVCGTCQDCWEPEKDCQCYQSPSTIGPKDARIAIPLDTSKREFGWASGLHGSAAE